jgi:DNA-binding XRE family transcriptional regulator
MVNRMRLSPVEVARRRKTISEAKDRGDAARILGMSRRNLLYTEKSLQREHDFEARFRKAYKRTKSDQELADAMEISRPTAIARRRRYGLPAKAVAMQKFTYGQYRGAYESTKNDADAAAMLGEPVDRFTNWRRYQKLPAKRQPGVGLEETVRRLTAYIDAADDGAAAKKVGLRRSTYTAWRTRHHLPPNYPGLVDAVSRTYLRRRLADCRQDEQLEELLMATRGYALTLRKRTATVPTRDSGS